MSLETSFGMGEATSNNRLHACVLAENRALENSLINYSQRQFQFTNQTFCTDTSTNSYCSFIKEVDASTSGTIRSVVERVKRRDNNTCFVEVKVVIEPAVQLPVDVQVSRIYSEGDPIDVKINVDQPLYLYIFNLFPEGVRVLFPNPYARETLIDNRFVFPDKNYQLLANSNGKQESKETLVFLFTKRRQNIDRKFIETGGSLPLKELLQSIPVNEKRLIVKNIVIRSE